MKKLILSIVPALMLLGSCAGAQPKVESKLFQEDTLAHEEIFGSVEEAFKKAPRESVDPDPDAPAPKIIVQQKDNGDDTVSVRFAAAVDIADKDLAESTASWNRAMYAPDGTQLLAPADKGCKTAYKSLVENGKTITAGEEGSEYAAYTRFVVYSMLNIPVGEEDPETDAVEDYSKYCFKVRLTVNDVQTDNVYASTVDLTKRVSFAADKTGTFMKGTFNGVANTVIDADEITKGSGNYASFTYDFVTDEEDVTKSDSFYIIRNVDGDFRVLGWDNWLGGSSNFAKNAKNNQIQPKYTNRHVIYCANNCNLYVSDPQYVLYNSGTKTNLDNTVPSGWEDKADYLVNAEAGATLSIKRYGEEYSKTIGDAGYYRAGLNKDSEIWAQPLGTPYICGSWNEWASAVGKSQFALSNVGEREFAIELNITGGSEFKIVTSGDSAWYGENGTSSSNIKIDATGDYRIHFYPIPSGNNTFVWCESLS